jgi:hypothetical protein
MRHNTHIWHLFCGASIFVASGVANSLIGDAVHNIEGAFTEWSHSRQVAQYDTSWDSGSYELKPYDSGYYDIAPTKRGYDLGGGADYTNYGGGGFRDSTDYK